MDVVLHCPITFSKILKLDGFLDEMESSFDIVENFNLISKRDKPSGGKSGEFFFFTYDNKFFIKTMKNEEMWSLKRRVQDFFEYYRKHPDTLIAKILGIFTFTSKDKSEVINILIMRNLATLPRSYILRVYDLKGSEYDRAVLKAGDKVGPQVKQTLKDLDFNRLEGKIHVISNYQKLLRLQLYKDVSFLQRQRLIDYSLLVIKGDWDSYCEDTGIPRQVNKNELLCIQSTQEKCYYHVGIIDYLQEWNVNKKVEKLGKKLMHLQPKLDTSSQNPDVYGQRFIKKIIDSYF